MKKNSPTPYNVPHNMINILFKLLLLQLLISINFTAIAVTAANENQPTSPTNNEAINRLRTTEYNDEKILSRPKRYIIFPTGSSLQLVYDQIVTIVEHSNIFTMGITVAVAYPLPNTPYLTEEELKEQYENGTLNLLWRIDSNITDYTNYNESGYTIPINSKYKNYSSSYWSPDLYQQYYGFVDNLHNSYNKHNQNRVQDSYYFGHNNHNIHDEWNGNEQYWQTNPSTTTNKSNYYIYGNPYNRNESSNRYFSYDFHNTRKPIDMFLSKSSQKSSAGNQRNTKNDWYNEEPRTFDQSIKPTSQLSTNQIDNEYEHPFKKQHFTYLALGKRSLIDMNELKMNDEDKMYMEHHRATRHSLYQIIEKYLQAKGYDGPECVRRALCEAGQKRHETDPGTFISEILRAIFSLPHPVNGMKSHIRNSTIDDYDNAHWMTQNCSQQFLKCNHSAWSSFFIL